MNEEEVGNMIVRLTGDGSSFQKMLQDAEKQAESSAKQLQTIGQRIEGIQKSMSGFASSAVAALASIGAGGILKSAFNSYVQLEQGQLRLKAAIEGNGGAVDELVPKYQAFASTLADLTNHTKGETLGLIQQAEMRGVSGDAAEKLVKQSIALASATQGEASSILIALNAAKDGNTEMLQRQLRLRGVKDETELNTRINKLMTTGWKTAQAEGASLGGQLTKLQNSLEGIKKQLGPIIAEYISPLIGKVKAVVDVFKNLDEGSKRMAVGILAGVAAFFLLGPAIAAIKTAALIVFSPIILAVSALGTALTALASPIGLVTLALTALSLELVHLTGSGPAIVQGLKTAFNQVKDNWTATYGAIKNAVAAGDLALAFEIAWSQVTATFLTSTATMRTGWINLKFEIQKGFIEAAAANQTFWAKFTEAAQHAKVEAKLLFRQITQAQADELHKQINDKEKLLQKADTDRFDKMRAGAVQGAKDAVKEANDAIAEIQGKLADKQETSFWEKFFGGEAAIPDDGFDDLSVGISKAMKKGAEEGKKAVDAAMTGSAEAIARMHAYDDALEEMRKGKGAAEGAGGGGKNGGANNGAPGIDFKDIPFARGAGGQAGFGGDAFVGPIVAALAPLQAIIAEGQRKIDEGLEPNWAKGARLQAGMAIGPRFDDPEAFGLPKGEAKKTDPAVLMALQQIAVNTKKQAEKKADIDLAAAELEEL